MRRVLVCVYWFVVSEFADASVRLLAYLFRPPSARPSVCLNVEFAGNAVYFLKANCLSGTTTKKPAGSACRVCLLSQTRRPTCIATVWFSCASSVSFLFFIFLCFQDVCGASPNATHVAGALTVTVTVSGFRFIYRLTHSHRFLNLHKVCAQSRYACLGLTGCLTDRPAD